MKAISAITAALLLAGAQPASAQLVFGLKEGTPSSSLNVRRSYDNNDFSVIVPQPEAEFESYMVTAPPGTGVCRITGLGVSYLGPNAERDVKKAFARIEAQINAKYGKGEFLTFTKTKDSFAEQIFSQNAAWATFWPYGVSASSPALDENVKSIGLSIEALEEGDLYLSLRYEFRNYNSGCKRK
jgi:hypothetical protein